MAYTDIDKPSDYFETKLYTGNAGSEHAISGVGFAAKLGMDKTQKLKLNPHKIL